MATPIEDPSYETSALGSAQTRKGIVIPFTPLTRFPKDDCPLAEREAEPRCFLVETIGFEPMTPCLQSRCSTN